MREIPRFGSGHQLRAAGITDYVQRRLVAEGADKVARGHLVIGSITELTAVERARLAVQVGGQDAIACGLTAAALWGLTAADGLPGFPSGAPRDRLLHVIRDREGGIRTHAMVRTHRWDLDPRDVTTRHGTPCTTAIRTVADILREQPLYLSVAVLDQALHLGLITVEAFDQVFAINAGKRGAASARQALGLARVGAESPLETVSRLELGRLGLHPAELQSVVRDRGGRFLARVDFRFCRGNRVVYAEADGMDVHDSPQARWRDADREDAINRATGSPVVRWVWRDMVERPAEIRDRIVRHLG